MLNYKMVELLDSKFTICKFNMLYQKLILSYFATYRLFLKKSFIRRAHSSVNIPP
jgi:hypothetical protein